MKKETPIQGHYDTSSVFVAVIGRPNVGKSSLTNLLVGEKVAIVTSKPQTTRTRITGVITRGPLQYVLLDTPGVHKAHNKLGKRMDKTASDSIADVDVSMMLFEPYGALNEPEMVLVEALKKSGGPAIAVINKTDLVKAPEDLEARKAELKALGVFDDIYTVSVRQNDHCEELFDALSRYAVEGPHYFVTMLIRTCRKKSWWQRLSARKRCCLCGTRSRMALPWWSSGSKNARVPTLWTLTSIFTASGRATRAWSLARAVPC